MNNLNTDQQQKVCITGNLPWILLVLTSVHLWNPSPCHLVTSSYISITSITQSVFFDHTPVNCVPGVKQTWFWHKWLIFQHMAPTVIQSNPSFVCFFADDMLKSFTVSSIVQECKKKMGLWKGTRLNINLVKLNKHLNRQ